jgi:hypothetical protein
MRLRGLRIALVAAAVAVAGASPLHAQTVVYIQTAPPSPPREVVVVRPGAAYVWVPGFHTWNGRTYVWVPGRWAMPPAGMVVWVPGRWVSTSRGYYWIAGHWRR